MTEQIRGTHHVVEDNWVPVESEPTETRDIDTSLYNCADMPPPKTAFAWYYGVRDE